MIYGWIPDAAEAAKSYSCKRISILVILPEQITQRTEEILIMQKQTNDLHMCGRLQTIRVSFPLSKVINLLSNWLWLSEQNKTCCTGADSKEARITLAIVQTKSHGQS